MKKIIKILVVVALGANSCNNSMQQNKEITDDMHIASAQEKFSAEIDSQCVDLYQISNGEIQVSLTNYGARLVSIFVPDKSDNKVDVILGYDSGLEFKENAANYYGAVVGRYGNRIGNATFELDGEAYQLEKNDGENSLHGGINGLYNKVWNMVDSSSNSITFGYNSPDGEAGYPGNVDILVKYTVNNYNGLLIEYKASTDKQTVLNLTSHGYFNLNGAGDTSILDHELWIDADHYTVVDESLIPTGKNVHVSGTPFDFRCAKLIGRDIDQDDAQLQIGMGYDHNFELNKKDGFKEVASVFSAKTGVEMKVLTTEPGLQFYSGNFMSEHDPEGKDGNTYPFRSAFCLETQHYPDGPNQASFPSTILNPGDTYSSKTEYRFSVR